MSSYVTVPQSFTNLIRNIFGAYPTIFKKLWPLFLGIAVIQIGVGILNPKSVMLIALLIGFLGLAVVLLYLHMVALYAGDQLLKQGNFAWRAVFAATLNRFGWIFLFMFLSFLLYLVVYLVIGFGFGGLFHLLNINIKAVLPIMFIVLGFLVILLYFGPVAILLDKVKLFPTFKVSARLVWGNWWRIFFVFLMIGLIVGLVFGAPYAFVQLSNQFSAQIKEVVHILFILAIVIFYMPLQVALILVLYNDLKRRKPGLVASA